ncbi:MAG: sigma-70 family RNA polymerase sigma factor [Candidatus Doudnabacteria bacterium]|nr:sigma-70 family RNA polymerase sigma factor [Candidatus Doudnabacteria bacterium]
MENENLAIQSCQRGDLQAFGILYDSYVLKIYNFIYYRTHHKETAEDLTSVTFTKALSNINSFNFDAGTFSAWLHRIARNTVIDHYRTFKSTTDILDGFDLAGHANVERDVDTAMKLEKVQDYLSQLPSQQRDIVIMRVWDNLSYREIGAILGKSEASCKVSFSRIMHKLQQERINV